MYFNDLLDILYPLTVCESERELTKEETALYVSIADYLHANNIDIPFGIEL